MVDRISRGKFFVRTILLLSTCLHWAQARPKPGPVQGPTQAWPRVGLACQILGSKQISNKWKFSRSKSILPKMLARSRYQKFPGPILGSFQANFSVGRKTTKNAYAIVVIRGGVPCTMTADAKSRISKQKKNAIVMLGGHVAQNVDVTVNTLHNNML